MDSKLQGVLKSRKFWALVASLVAVIGGFYTGQIPAQDAANNLVIALAVYSIATGIEDNGKGNPYA